MIIGIYSLRNHRYHPNRRLFEAARDLNHQAVLVNPKKLLMEVSDQGLRIDSVTRSLQVDVIMPRIGANIKEYALTMVRHFELMGITVGDEFIRSDQMEKFTGVQSDYYWSSTTSVGPSNQMACIVHMLIGHRTSVPKNWIYYVWPVRADNIGY